jgi:hypothetical protein
MVRLKITRTLKLPSFEIKRVCDVCSRFTDESVSRACAPLAWQLYFISTHRSDYDLGRWTNERVGRNGQIEERHVEARSDGGK